MKKKKVDAMPRFNFPYYRKKGKEIPKKGCLGSFHKYSLYEMGQTHPPTLGASTL
jgi:hypothetical protein